MNDILKSELLQKLKDGQLPTVTVEAEISTSSMLTLGIVILVVGTVLIAGAKLMK